LVKVQSAEGLSSGAKQAAEKGTDLSEPLEEAVAGAKQAAEKLEVDCFRS
jgi:hypothetical protein